MLLCKIFQISKLQPLTFNLDVKLGAVNNLLGRKRPDAGMWPQLPVSTSVPIYQCLLTNPRTYQMSILVSTSSKHIAHHSIQLF